MFIIRIRREEKSFNLIKGEVYKAERYLLDPHEKFSLIEVIGHNPKKEPSCNVYIESVDILIMSKWHNVVNGTFKMLPEEKQGLCAIPKEMFDPEYCEKAEGLCKNCSFYVPNHKE